jgi:hypothetical protein
VSDDIQPTRPGFIQRMRRGLTPMPYDPEQERLAREQHDAAVDNNEVVSKWWERSQKERFAESFDEIVSPSRTGNNSSLEPRRSAQGPNAIVASAVRITNKTVASTSFRRTTHESWQDDGWSMYDLVPELRFVSTTLAQRTSKAKLFIGQVADDPNTDPTPVEDDGMKQILEALGDGHLGMSRLVERLTINLFIPGDGWLVGIPKDLIEESDAERDAREVNAGGGSKPSLQRGYGDIVSPQRVDRAPNANPASEVDDEPLDQSTLDSLDWRMLSIAEVQFIQGDLVQLRLGPTEQEIIRANPDDLYLIRVWRPHPKYWWSADSPTRSALPVLRELVGLTMHISAQVDSRLAGAGLFIVPESAARAAKRAAGLPDDSAEDPFTDALIQSMLTPIGDRSNASAVVPLVVTSPDDVADKFNHITFDKPLDTEARPLREEAIRRLALGLDAPPELLLGTDGMNHWGAWLVQEEVVTAHIEPPLQLICDALTTQYLRPILVANGKSIDEAEKYVIWYDVSDLIVRPNRSADAQVLYEKGAISAKALRKANGFDEDDAPAEEIDDPAIKAAFEMVQQDPALMLRPGLDLLVQQLRALLKGTPMGAIDGTSAEDAAKAVSGPNAEDVDNPAPIEPVSPPVAPKGDNGQTPARNPGAVPSTAGSPLAQPAMALEPLVPAMLNVPDGEYELTPADLIVDPNWAPEPVGAFAIQRGATMSISGLGIRGSLSQQLDSFTPTDDDVFDLTGL